MNKLLEKKTKAIEQLKEKKLNQKKQLDQEIQMLNESLKQLHDFKKTEEKIDEMRRSLNEKIDQFYDENK